MPILPGRPSLKQMLALSQLTQDRFEEAEATLRHEIDPETRLLAAEMASRRDVKEAVSIVEKIDVADDPPPAKGEVADIGRPRASRTRFFAR